MKLSMESAAASLLGFGAVSGGFNLGWVLAVVGLSLLGMALSTTSTAGTNFGPMPQPGFWAKVTVAFDSSYPTGGEVWDLSGLFTNKIKAAMRCGDTLNDGGWIIRYVPAASGAPATGVLQAYENAAAADAFPEATSTQDLSAINGIEFLILGD